MTRTANYEHEVTNTRTALEYARNRGWPDSALAIIAGCTEERIRQARLGQGEMSFDKVLPIYKKVVIEKTMFGGVTL